MKGAVDRLDDLRHTISCNKQVHYICWRSTVAQAEFYRVMHGSFQRPQIYNDPCRYILFQNLTNSSPNFRKFLPHLWIFLLCGHVLISGMTLLLLLNWTSYTLIVLHWLHNRIILSILLRRGRKRVWAGKTYHGQWPWDLDDNFQVLKVT